MHFAPNKIIIIRSLTCHPNVLPFQCTRRQTRMMKYRMSDDIDPDDIGYRRSWGNGETNYAYDNKQEAMTTNEEMKHPVPFFDVGSSDIKDTQELDPVSALL